MKLSRFLVILLVPVIVLSGCVDQGITGEAVGANCRKVEVPYTETEYYTETVPYSDVDCESKPLVYSITDFTLGSVTCNERDVDCHRYFLGICVDKTDYCLDRSVSCSLTVNNLDDERGSWTIRFDFLKSGSISYAATDSTSIWLYPHTSDTVVGSGRVTTRERLDASYTCSHGVTSEPTKQICRDVTKYREEQRTRGVTKYRTETVCD